jgi:hypothetical protein
MRAKGSAAKAGRSAATLGKGRRERKRTDPEKSFEVHTRASSSSAPGSPAPTPGASRKGARKDETPLQSRGKRAAASTSQRKSRALQQLTVLSSSSSDEEQDAEAESDDDPLDVLPPGSAKARKRKAGKHAAARPRLASETPSEEEAESEEEEPFGGILVGAEADTSKTKPMPEDVARFEASKRAAEVSPGRSMADGLCSRLGQGQLGGEVASLPGTSSGRVPKRPGLASSSSAAAGYFTGSPWAGTGSVSEASRRAALGPAAAPPASPSLHPLPGTGGSLATPATPATPGTPGMPASALPPSAVAGSSSARAAESGTALPIKTIRFADFDIDTWFQAPYPEEYSLVPDGRLWICEHCLKYMKSRFVAIRHRVSAPRTR